MFNILQKSILKYWENREKCSLWPIAYPYPVNSEIKYFGKGRDDANNRSSPSLNFFRLLNLSLSSIGDQRLSRNKYSIHVAATSNVSITALANAVNLLDSLITSQPTASSSNGPPLTLSLANQTPSQLKIAGKVAETKLRFGE